MCAAKAVSYDSLCRQGASSGAGGSTGSALVVIRVALSATPGGVFLEGAGLGFNVI